MSDILGNAALGAGRMNRAWCAKCKDETVHGDGHCTHCKTPQSASPVTVLDPTKFEPRETLKRPAPRLVIAHEASPAAIDDELLDERPAVYAEAIAAPPREHTPPARPVREVEVSTTKQCTKCEVVKGLEEFYAKQSHCKACMKEDARERYKRANPAAAPRTKAVQTSAGKPPKRLPKAKGNQSRPAAPSVNRAPAGNGELRIAPSAGLVARLDGAIVELVIGELDPARVSPADLDALTTWWSKQREAA